MEAIRNEVRRLPLLALLTVLVLLSSGPDAHAAIRAPSSSGPRALYTALAGDRTGFWVAPASAPERASRIASVAHREGYGVRARPSPDGRLVAYTLWPPGNAETPAELWVLSVASGETTRLLAGNDLHSPPLWSPDSVSVVARQGTGLLLVEVRRGGTGFQPVRQDEILPHQLSTGLLGVYPFAWSPTGDGIYYGAIGGGTSVHYVDLASGTERRLFQASEGIARDFSLGPGDVIRYSEVTPGGLVARVVDLSGAPVAGGDHSPLPNPALTRALSQRERGFGEWERGLSAEPTSPPAHIPGHVEFAGWLP